MQLIIICVTRKRLVIFEYKKQNRNELATTINKISETNSSFHVK